MPEPLSFETLKSKLPYILGSPKDHGNLMLIVTRPDANERTMHDSVEVSAERGVHGDVWSRYCWLTLPDGRPDPDVQIYIMNARCIEIIAQKQERWQLAGDNLFIDMDLSEDNLRSGQRLTLGSSILEITAQAHNACLKFANRFGRDAARFVNNKQARHHRLRGIYAKVVQPGTVSVGDKFSK